MLNKLRTHLIYLASKQLPVEYNNLFLTYATISMVYWGVNFFVLGIPLLQAIALLLLRTGILYIYRATPRFKHVVLTSYRPIIDPLMEAEGFVSMLTGGLIVMLTGNYILFWVICGSTLLIPFTVPRVTFAMYNLIFGRPAIITKKLYNLRRIP